MPSKTEEYLALAQRTANGLTRYWESWTAYLTTASRLYKYRFEDQLMIYAQRPDATACADYDIWNNRMNRYVRRGSKGIAVLDESSFPFSCVRHTTHLFYHELRNYAIDACTKKRPGFSERVCIDTFNSVRKECAACTGTVQIRKGLGFPNKHFATQNLHLCARMHCLLQWCWF